MRYSRKIDQVAMMDFKDKLAMAFKAMRKHGLIARQNFWCCQSCAGYASVELATKRIDAGKTVNGICYYHNQDNQNLRDGDDFYLAYGQIESQSRGKIGKSSKEVGDIVADCLNGVGIAFEWNENPDTRIRVINPAGRN